MELNWSTFILEILNFGVLLWLLRHFLYRPVLDIIERRQQKINAALEEARQDRSKAEALQAEYSNRLDDWQQEREKALEKLQQEFTTLRARQMQQLQEELEEQREKARIAIQREQEGIIHAAEKAALRQGSEFAGKLLKPLADEALEAALVNMFVTELDALSDAAAEQLRSGVLPQGTVEISSAWPLDKDQQKNLQQALARVLKITPILELKQDATLLAGLRIVAGGMVLGANLRDELKAFTEFHSEDGMLDR